jgi:hypothetical protein
MFSMRWCARYSVLPATANCDNLGCEFHVGTPLDFEQRYMALHWFATRCTAGHWA